MELLKSHFFKMRKAYIESFIILLFLSCCPFIVSSCHEEEKEEISDSPFDEEDIQHEQDLNAYLGKTYSCKGNYIQSYSLKPLKGYKFSN